jgi:hypothetical protein
MSNSTGFDALARDLSSVPARLAPKIRPVVSRGALNVKTQLQAEARESSHFSSLASSIGYELLEDTSGVQADIGPDRERGGGAGLLMAYWGQSRGGGGTLPDPLGALEAEAPGFVSALEKVAASVLD